MEEIVLYTTNCPKCIILKNQLKNKGINFIENDDINEMKSLGFYEVPKLKIADNKFLAFGDALTWLNNVNKEVD